MDVRTIQRPPLAFPDEAASPGMRRKIERVAACADAARAVASALNDAELAALAVSYDWRAHAADLTHPLSANWLGRRAGDGARVARDRAEERDGYRRAATAFAYFLGARDDAVAFDALRAGASALLGEGAGALRTQPIGLDADADGTSVRFGDWRCVPARLAALRDGHARSTLPAPVKAIVALAIFLNIHPFADGNGRCARALYNAALAPTPGGLSTYLPLRAVLDASCGGFEIRVRDAETNGNWAPLFDYFATVFAAWERACAARHRSLAKEPS